MVIFMSSRIIQRKERFEFIQRFLRLLSTHFLRFIKNYNRSISPNDVDRSPAAKLVQLHADPPSILASGIKRLHIDNHHRQIRIGTKVINISQIFGVIDKKTSLFPIILHEMILHHLEAFLNTFTDRNGWYNYNKLTPPILLVQLEHRLDINIGFTGSGLHLYIKRADPHMFCKGRGLLYVIIFLNFLDILK